MGVINSGLWEEVNYVETRAGETRGGHYHKETKELFFIIEGAGDVSFRDLLAKQTQRYSFEKGAIFVIDPYEVHTFECRTDCKWINILSKRLDDQFHDIHLPDATS
jgi:mannose-6-phosphate isomerase-like protein (cupin superfamily)